MPDEALHINTNQAISKDAQVLQGEQRSGKSTYKLDSVKVGEDQASLMSSQKVQGSQGKDTRQPNLSLLQMYESHNSQKCPFIKERCYHCGILGHTASNCRKTSALGQMSWRVVTMGTFTMSLTVKIGKIFL